MKVAISSTGQELSSQVEPRFGRSPYFIFIDPETMQFEAIANPNDNAMGGAGIQTAQLVANNGVEVVLTGSCGPNAYKTLQAAGVKVMTGVVGIVEEAVKKFKSGQYKPSSGPNVASHCGMGYGMPFGGGFGMRGGMGRGLGRGMRGAMGYGFGPAQQSSAPADLSYASLPAHELRALKQQADYLKLQLDIVNNRIKELESKK
jgi:predicted Fe-Mo cluster-binding NifX family protein